MAEGRLTTREWLVGPELSSAVLHAVEGYGKPMRFRSVLEAVGGTYEVSHPSYRAVDRTLQQLRKADAIHLVTGAGGGWIPGPKES